MTEARFFCMEQLEASKEVLKQLSSQLPKVKYALVQAQGKKRQAALAALQELVKRLWEEFPKVVRSLQEIDDAKLVQTAVRLYDALKRYDYLGVPNFERLCKALKEFLGLLPCPAQIASCGRLMNRVKMGHYPTDLAHVDWIKQAIAFPEGKTVNLLDPCCGTGQALAHLASGQNAVTYGIEIDQERAQQALARLNRVGFGSYFFSHVSRQAFHCLFLNPPYLSVQSEHGIRRLEKAFLADSFRTLMMGGLLVYIIPYYRFTEDICRLLMENFEHLRLYRFVGKEFERFRQIAVVGYRRPRTVCMEISGLLESTLHPEEIPALDQLGEKSLALPATAQKVSSFRGEVFNVTELAAQLQQSQSLDKLFQSNALEYREQRPLLPLNVSQIGLIGASGAINGLVEGEVPHVITGRIVKETKTSVVNLDQDRQKVQKITSNRLVFNVLSPDGFRSLS